jgi:peptidoglycan/LPS O-acetylase OafA/YrhL
MSVSATTTPRRAEDKPSKHFIGLDGLRGVASFAVVFFHGTLFIENAGYTPYAASLAVDFFFLLSGFVVAHAYDARLERAMTGRQFMTIRIIRLYPMLFVGTAVGGLLFVMAQFQKHDVNHYVILLIAIGSFALIPVGLAASGVAYPVNAAMWSMFFEFAVNALYSSRFGRLGNRNLAIFVAISGFALIPMAIWGGPYDRIGFASPTSFLLGFVRATYPFWAGVLLFRVVPLHVMPKLPIVIIGAALTSLLLAPVNSPTYNLLLVLAVFPAIVALGASAAVGNRLRHACSWLGRLSYPLYLIHIPVFRIANRAADRIHVSPWALIVGGSILSVIAADVLLVAFDEPVRKWLSQVHQGPNAQGRALRTR